MLAFRNMLVGVSLMALCACSSAQEQKKRTAANCPTGTSSKNSGSSTKDSGKSKTSTLALAAVGCDAAAVACDYRSYARGQSYGEAKGTGRARWDGDELSVAMTRYTYPESPGEGPSVSFDCYFTNVPAEVNQSLGGTGASLQSAFTDLMNKCQDRLAHAL